MSTAHRSLLVLVALLSLAVAARGAPARDLAQEESNRHLVLDFYAAFFGRHDLAAAEATLSEGYVQHNPRVPTGRAAFVATFTRLFAANPQSSSQVVRSGTDGDLVFLHSHATANPSDRGRAIVDIFRVQDGKIVEHWDVIQDVPESAANNNTMF